MKVDRAGKLAAQGAKLAIKYGPQAKIVWERGGRRAVMAAGRRTSLAVARRRAWAHGSRVIDGSILKIAPAGSSLFVVFSGDQPIATYPPQTLPYAVLLEHADLSRRMATPSKPFED